MKHLLFALALFALSSNLLAQKCSIPIAIRVESSPYTSRNDEERLEVLFSNYLQTNGFLRDDKSLLRFRLLPVFIERTRAHSGKNVGISMNIVLEDISTNEVLNFAHIDTLVYTHLPTWELVSSSHSTDDGYADNIHALYDYGNCFANKNSRVDKLFETMRDKIVSYYDLKAPKLLENARQYVAKGYEDEVLFHCWQFPTCCQHFPEVVALAVQVFQSYVNTHPAEAVKEAENVWDKDKSGVNARYAVALINNAELTDKEMKAAKHLIDKIKKKYPQMDVVSKTELTKDESLRKLLYISIMRVAKSVGLNHINIYSL